MTADGERGWAPGAGRRRWCATERGGNRNKVRAHRVRHAEHAEGDGR
ncbi:CGNR zinc finger domain-containing protein [Streptomyces sp. V1I1]